MADIQKFYDHHKGAGAYSDLELKYQSLCSVFHETYNFTGNRDEYDHLRNADIVQVVMNRTGLPISLCLLCVYIGSRLQWTIDGLAIPGHYLCRIEDQGQRIVFDPFHNCKEVHAPDIRQMVKNVMGPHAELSADYFEPASRHSILIRLQNNIKLRQVEAGDYKNAIVTIEKMRLIDPQEYRLLFDAGVLYFKVGQSMAAMRSLQRYIENCPDPKGREEARMFLQQIKEKLH